MSKIGFIYGNSFFHFGFQSVYNCRVFFVICIKPMNYFMRQVIATDKVIFFKFCVFCFVKVSVVDLITFAEFMPRNIIKPTAFYTHFLRTTRLSSVERLRSIYPFFSRLFILTVRVPTVTYNFAAMDDIFRGSFVPMASMICISLFVISRNSSVITALDSASITRLNKLTSNAFNATGCFLAILLPPLIKHWSYYMFFIKAQ